MLGSWDVVAFDEVAGLERDVGVALEALWSQEVFVARRIEGDEARLNIKSGGLVCGTPDDAIEAVERIFEINEVLIFVQKRAMCNCQGPKLHWTGWNFFQVLPMPRG